MAVSLPTAADVRKVRAQAARNVAERAEVVRTPLLAALGAGEYAVTTVTKVATDARTRAEARRHAVAERVEKLPAGFGELRAKLTVEELRKVLEGFSADVRVQVEKFYADYAARGEQAWGRIRKQPQVRQAIATIESYTEKLDARVDELVDDAHDAAEKALQTVTTQTRSTGERVARATQRFAGRAAETVTAVTHDAADALTDAGTDVAEGITEAGDEVAHETRSTTRKAANRTAPKAPARKPAAPKPAQKA